MVETSPPQAVRVILEVLKERRYRKVAMASALAYALFYMVFTGILTYVPLDLSSWVPIPFLLVYTEGPIGYVPLVIFAPTNHLVFSMNLQAAIVTLVLSSLVGANVFLLFYGSRQLRCSCRQGAVMGLAGMVPGCLTLFACCGGGLLTLLFGTGALTLLLPKATLFFAAGALLLSLSLLNVSYSISRQAPS